MVSDAEIEDMLLTYSAAVAESLPTPSVSRSSKRSGPAHGHHRRVPKRSSRSPRPQRVLVAAALLAFVAVVAAVAVVVDRDRSHPGWTALPPAPLDSIARPTGLWDGHDFVVFGRVEHSPDGETATTVASAAPRSPADEGSAFNPVTRSWTRLPPLAIPTDLVAEPVDPSSGVLTVLFASNGCDIPPLRGSLGALYDVSTRRWETIPSPPFALANCEGWLGAWRGTRLYLWPAGAPDGRRGGGAYDRTTRTWSPLAAQPRSISALVSTGDRIYGVTYLQPAPFGRSHIGQRHPTTVISFNPAAGTWGAVPDAPYSPLSAVAVAGQLVIWDGHVAARLDPASGRWVDLGAAPLAPRIDASVVASGRMLVVWGGSSLSAVATFDADGATLDLTTGRWRSLPASSLSGRSNAASAVTGSRLYLWGGDAAAPGRLADGAAARLGP